MLTLRLTGLSGWEARNCSSDKAACTHFVTSGRRGEVFIYSMGVFRSINYPSVTLEQRDSIQACVLTMRRSCVLGGLCLSIGRSVNSWVWLSEEQLCLDRAQSSHLQVFLHQCHQLSLREGEAKTGFPAGGGHMSRCRLEVFLLLFYIYRRIPI